MMELILSSLLFLCFLSINPAQHIPVDLKTILTLEFDYINSIISGPTGNLIVVDSAIWDVNINVEPPTKTLIVGSMEPGHSEGRGANVQFSFASDIILLNQTHLLVSDTNNFCVRLVHFRKKFSARYAGRCRKRGFIDGERLSARFREPSGMEKFGDMIYIVDGQFSNAIRVLQADVVNTLYTIPELETGKYLTGISPDVFYVTMNHGIVKIQMNRTESETFQRLSGAAVEGFADGTLASSRYHIPSGIVMLNNHTLAVADNRNHRLRLVDLESDTVSSICSGREEYVDGNRTQCSFNAIWNVHVYEDMLLIADGARLRTLPLHSLIADPNYVPPSTVSTTTSRTEATSQQPLESKVSTTVLIQKKTAAKETTTKPPKHTGEASRQKGNNAHSTTATMSIIGILVAAIWLF